MKHRKDYLGRTVAAIYLIGAIVIPGKTLMSRMDARLASSRRPSALQLYLAAVYPFDASRIDGNFTENWDRSKLPQLLGELAHGLRAAGCAVPPAEGDLQTQLTQRLFAAGTARVIPAEEAFWALWNIGTPDALSKAVRLTVSIDISPMVDLSRESFLERRPMGPWYTAARRMLASDNPVWRRNSVVLMTSATVPDWHDLRAALHDKDPLICRIAAVRCFADHHITAQDIIALMQRNNADIFSFLCDHMSDGAPAAVQHYLVHQLTGRPDETTDRIIDILTAGADREALHRVRELAVYGPPFVAAAAYRYLCRMGDATDVALMLGGMTGSEIQCRYAAQSTADLTDRLAHSGHPLPPALFDEVTRRIVALTDDTSAGMRCVATNACGTLAANGAAAAAQRLRELCHDPDIQTQRYARRCLLRAGLKPADRS